MFTVDVKQQCNITLFSFFGALNSNILGIQTLSTIEGQFSIYKHGPRIVPLSFFSQNCRACQCWLLRRKFIECSIINPALSLLIKHLVIGQRQKAPNFSAFHWSPQGSLISIGQHFVTTRVVHLPKKTETSLITESDQAGPNHQIGQVCAGHA